MAAGTLFTYPKSFRANKALIAAEISGADVKIADNFKLGETNKTADFLKKFPNGKVPAFEAKDGFCVSESNAIAHFVANSELRGTDSKQEALVQQWVSFSDNEILPAACTWTFPCLGITQFNKQDTERAKQQIQKALGVLNEHLVTRTYLVGERVTIADISLVCNLQGLYELVLDPNFRKAYGNVNRWFTTLINQPPFKKVLGTVELAASMATFDAKKYQEIHGAGGDKKKEKKDDTPAKKGKPESKAKEQKSPAPKSEPEVAQEPPKPKDPLAEIPKGKMDLDEFKRTYSNEDIAKVAVPYFWQHFDREALSIWRCDYSETIEPKTKGFMLSNLVTGWFQRIEKLRKHAFGSVVISGSPSKKAFAISGIWFWRGHKQVFELCEDWNVDAPSYTWKKLDVDSEETKEMVLRYFLQEGEFDGMEEIVDGKIFK